MNNLTPEEIAQHETIYATPYLPAFNADWVSERIMAGRNPLSAQDVAWMESQGITHILDLREAREWKPPKFGHIALEAIQQRGLHRLHLEVMDMNAPKAQTFKSACDFIEEALAQPETKVYVHCRAGMERTAAILIAYHAKTNGITYDEALHELKKGRPILEPLPAQEQAARRWIEQQKQHEI
jgi:protein-tyrosine phosphatase